MNYEDFIASKLIAAAPVGIPDPILRTRGMFQYQIDVTTWSLRLGKSAMLLDCGLGKSVCQLEWARAVHEHTGRDVLILAPLAVAKQTVREGEKFGIAVRYCRKQDEVQPGITVANYEMLHAFDPLAFVGIVLDESSILKSYDSKTRNQIIEAFRETPFRLACTATPAPNDYVELGNHAEFLGVMSRAEMLATFFVHDGGDTSSWRLKGHAEQDFWRWVCSWAVMARRPSDLGYSDDGFALPPLRMHQHVIPATVEQAWAAGRLFADEAKTLSEQRAARKSTLSLRARKCAEIVQSTHAPWLIWCELNAEAAALRELLPNAIEISGSDTPAVKEARMLDFANGHARILITKSSIAGFGMNWQHCANVAFVGVGHSYESFYQAIRRCWRFGQSKPVDCHVVSAEIEGRVVDSLQRKARDAEKMAEAMVDGMREIQRAAVHGLGRVSIPYERNVEMVVPDWIGMDMEAAS